MKKDLQKKYNEWRKEVEEENKWQQKHGGSHPIYTPWDCGEGSAREGFSNYAELDKEISFEEMLELEKNYEA